MGYSEDNLREQRRGDNIQVTSYDVTVSNTADDETTLVMVTMDGDEPPREKIEVRWRPQVSISGALERVYPRRGDKGIVIFPDEGAPWLIW
jgi:hypothetical protein